MSTRRVAVVTVSDGVTRGTREDASGELAGRILAEAGFELAAREVVPDERIVTTEVYEGVPGGDEDPAVNEVTFVDRGERSILEILMRCPSKEVRDAVIDPAMEGGMQEWNGPARADRDLAVELTRAPPSRRRSGRRSAVGCAAWTTSSSS